MAQNGEDKNRGRSAREAEEARCKKIGIVCIVLAAVFLAAAIVCVAVYVALRNDIMFIPLAVCLVIAMIAFTYARIKG